jgi:replicative DNA helicase
MTTAPYNEEAEQGVLACCQMSGGAHAQARRLVNADDFYLDSHRHIWRAMEMLRERGEEIDAISLTDTLADQGVLGECGGPTRIATITNDYPSASAVETYCRIVTQDAQRRRLQAATREAAGRLQANGNIEEVLGGLADVVRSFRSPKKKRVAVKAYEWIESTLQGEVGIDLSEQAPWFDALAGPLQRGAYYVLGGMSGHGKSTVASIIVAAAHKSDEKVRCLWFSCEMPEEFQMFRLMSAYHGTPEPWFLDARQVPADKRDNFFALGTKMVEMEKWCTILRMAPLDSRRIAMELEAEAAEYPDHHIICVVDYIQRAECGEKSDRENVARSSAILANAALNSGATVFALTQFTESQKREHPIPLPNAGQVRTAKDIEHDAVQVLIYHRPWGDRRCVLAMPKSRYPLRKPGVIHLEGDNYVATLKESPGSCDQLDMNLRRVEVGERCG